MKRSLTVIVCVVVLSVVLLSLMLGAGCTALNKPTIEYTYRHTKLDKYRVKTATVWHGLNRVTTDVSMEKLDPSTHQWKTVE